MIFQADTLVDRLRALIPDAEHARRFLIAYSGGLDSTVLLHSLAACRGELAVPIIAVHVNHGLHAAAADWESACRRFAGALRIPFESCRVVVPDDSGLGPEAAARQVRYAALQSRMQEGDCLVSAHHEGDQGETLLLNLMRGSGSDGLAGIAACQPFGPGLLLRPLLDVSEQSLSDYARDCRLDWLDDPSNADTRFDRNFLRQQIIPQLATRWPAVGTRLRRSAELASEASGLLAELAAIDLAASGTPECLDITSLGRLSEARQRNLLRLAVRSCGLPPPPATRLYQAIRELIPARADAQPLVRWPGAEIRRYRNSLRLLAGLADLDDTDGRLLKGDGEAVELGSNHGRLRLQAGAEPGIDRALADKGLQIRYRTGGEEIRPAGQSCTHKLRKLMQDAGVLPWMRQRIPLLYAGDRLAAVADLWLADEVAVPQGYAVCWENKPILH